MLNNTLPITKNIIILNIIMFLVSEYIFPSLQADFAGYLPTSPHFHFWQLITHMFMHGSIMHLAFNMLTLWNFGNILERTLGQKNYIILYFLSGIGSFILFNFWNYYQVYQLHQILANEGSDIREVYINSAKGMQVAFQETEAAYVLRSYLNTRMVGASGAVFGVIAGFATLFPNAQMYMMFIPFPIKAKILLPIVIAVSVYLGINQFAWDNIAHFAHIGGALVGWVLIRNWKKNRDRIY